MSCPLYKSYTNGIIFFNLNLNVQLNKVMCRTHVNIVPVKGQGHTWRSKLTCPLYKSYTKGRIFFKRYSNVQLNKVMCRTRVTLPAGLTSRSQFKVKIDSENVLKFNMYVLLKLTQVFAWNLTYIWRITSKICMSSFITLYCILTKLCPLLSLLITINSIQYIRSALKILY